MSRQRLALVWAALALVVLVCCGWAFKYFVLAYHKPPPAETLPGMNAGFDGRVAAIHQDWLFIRATRESIDLVGIDGHPVRRLVELSLPAGPPLSYPSGRLAPGGRHVALAYVTWDNERSPTEHYLVADLLNGQITELPAPREGWVPVGGFHWLNGSSLIARYSEPTTGPSWDWAWWLYDPQRPLDFKRLPFEQPNGYRHPSSRAILVQVRTGPKQWGGLRVLDENGIRDARPGPEQSALTGAPTCWPPDIFRSPGRFYANTSGPPEHLRTQEITSSDFLPDEIRRSWDVPYSPQAYSRWYFHLRGKTVYWCQHDVWDLEWDPDLGLWFWEESGRELQGPTQHYMDAEGNYRHWMEGLYIDKTLRALWPTASQAPATVSMTAP